MPLQSSLVHLGLAKETVQGTPVSPTVWVPVENNIKNEDVIHFIDDKSLMGAPVATIGQYAGPASSTVDWDANFYPEALGHAIMGLLGADAVSGTATPYTHVLTLSEAQPPSYTLSVYNGYNERQYPGSMIDELALKYATDGALVATTKWVGFPSVSGTTSTPVLPTDNPLLGWQASLQIATVANTRLIGFDWTGKRATKPVNTSGGTQAPTFVYAGPLDVTGKLTFAIDNETELDYLLNNTQPAVVLTLQAPNSGPSLAIQMSKCAFTKQATSYSKEWVEVDYDIVSVANSSDAGTGGPISPVKFTLINSQSTAY
ncbi:phage tail tube protein [Alicyclobacillus sp. ALC3]|uniref:phage tail tube protein n=1 Tax=Alicyclobacillus sp. ALC3 TaxID=2796143 RepID=UPI002379F721|nr:phage tail tube protein [Alicyclobacillus sp. ALC3]WDL97800.1 hypothetical protein JC200_03455 [Alicyclobacillus sp. ALC3]